MTAGSHSVSAERVDLVGRILNDTTQPLKARFRALFVLRNVGCDRSVEWIAKCFVDSSALLKHELAYCLGQTQNPNAVPVLTAVLDDLDQEAIVRHEAGEGLGALGDVRAVPMLEKYLKDESVAVAETCELALARIRWAQERKAEGKDPVGRSPYSSVDPTPAATDVDARQLGKTLVDSNKSLWERYCAMFALRNLNTDESIELLGKGLYCEDSALFRHEVAYVLGQTQSPTAVRDLRAGLENLDENHMVRHECAEALGAIGTDECTAVLQKYLDDKERVVSESCIVALDMADYENSDQFQYASVN